MTGQRDQVWQQPPDRDRDYRGFPARTVRVGSVWFREHAAAHGPWWFSSGVGRFDLRMPHGTCYLDDTPQPCVRERVGSDRAAHGRVAASVLASRVVPRLRLPADVRAANLESDRASDRYGVPGELTVMTPYDVTQQWADAPHRIGFGASPVGSASHSQPSSRARHLRDRWRATRLGRRPQSSPSKGRGRPHDDHRYRPTQRRPGHRHRPRLTTPAKDVARTVSRAA